MARRQPSPDTAAPVDGSGDEGVARPMRLIHPHGFFLDDGTHRYWAAGQLVEDGAELGLLRRRGVQLQEI